MHFAEINFSAFLPLITVMGTCLCAVLTIVFKLGKVSELIGSIDVKVDGIASLNTRVTQIETRQTEKSARLDKLEARLDKFMDDRR